MKAVHIHITGIVQGVGFRPFIYRLASRFNINGWVNNTTDGVHIHAEGSRNHINQFITKITSQPPALAYLKDFIVKETVPQGSDHFKIVSCEGHKKQSVMLTPDYAICQECENELFDPDSRRYRYPFITCTICGPRFSIIKSLPYDRCNTVMEPYTMCSACQEEYDQPLNRRFYSQTNSCYDCGFNLKLIDSTEGIIHDEGCSDERILEYIISELKKGKIIAVKGIGGYLIVCDATNENTILTLRERKNRPHKPFALIYPDVETLDGDLHVSKQELCEYQSVQAPIVLFKKHSSQASGAVASAIAPGLVHLGAMRPCAPLQSLISKDFNKPLVATSANISGSPIIYEDDEAVSKLTRIADIIVTHDRDILFPEDDSVLKITRQGHRIMIRRSRGFAPNYMKSFEMGSRSVLGLGGSMKSTFCISHNENTYVSQYLGDLGSYDSQLCYEHTLRHITQALNFRPEVVLTDKHPDYATTEMGKKLAEATNVKVTAIQHHEAHFAAVLGENHLYDESDPILGIIWDGTGYGNDHQIWGGEFLVYSERKFRRIHHLRYYSHVLGDKMSREPRISALSILSGSPYAEKIYDKFTRQELGIYMDLLKKPKLLTSSMGRLFDAAASILGLSDYNTYEGEAALLLEELASTCADDKAPEHPLTEDLLSPVYHLEKIINDLDQGISKAKAAWNFHRRLVLLIRYVAVDINVYKLAFSGGVFQNGLLIDMIDRWLGHEYEFYFHQELSPNDENISFGQIVHHKITCDSPSDVRESLIGQIHLNV